MSNIFVNHASLRQAGSTLGGLSSDLESDTARIATASQNLLSNWEGEGSAFFQVAATSLTSFLQGASLVSGAEALSISTASANFEAQDAAVASILSVAGE